MFEPDVIASLLPKSASDIERYRLVGKYYTELEVKILEYVKEQTKDYPDMLSVVQQYLQTDPNDPQKLYTLLDVSSVSPAHAGRTFQLEVELLNKYILEYLPKLNEDEQRAFWQKLEDLKDDLALSQLVLSINRVPASAKDAVIATVATELVTEEVA